MSISTVVAGRLPPQTGTAFVLARHDLLEVIDPFGRQVADIAAFTQADVAESFSAGRTLDYNERIYISLNAVLYSNRSNPLFTIVHDDVKRHDYLLTPCSRRMFELLRGMHEHPNCLENLAASLAPFGIGEDGIASTFNVFMNVETEADGRIAVGVPQSRAGDRIVLRAETELVVGLCACSSEATNAGRCKPIDFAIHPAP